MGQPKMKYWKLHKNEVKNVHPYEHMPKTLHIFNFEQLPKHILRVFPSLGWVNSIQFFWVRPLWFSALQLYKVSLVCKRNHWYLSTRTGIHRDWFEYAASVWSLAWVIGRHGFKTINCQKNLENPLSFTFLIEYACEVATNISCYSQQHAKKTKHKTMVLYNITSTSKLQCFYNHVQVFLSIIMWI